jgi:hypothetical protein
MFLEKSKSSMFTFLTIFLQFGVQSVSQRDLSNFNPGNEYRVTVWFS